MGRRAKNVFCKRSPRVARYLREPLSLERLCCGLVAIGSGQGSQDAARLSWAAIKTGQNGKNGLIFSIRGLEVHLKSACSSSACVANNN